MLRTYSNCALACLLALGVLSSSGLAADNQFDPAAVEFFEKQVRPILVARCHECHVGAEAKGSLRLDSRAAIVTGGDTGPAIVAGKPDESLLVDAVRYGDIYQMPPTSQLPTEEIKTLEAWVKLGAPWGSETAEAVVASAKEFDLAARSNHWSLQAIGNPKPPTVKNTSWVKTPVDRFLLAKLEAAGMNPAPAADRRALLRRVTYDLTGLPPTAAEIEAFVADASRGAYEKVVNRLLASPRYGERWARHWLDLVRFAETQGHEFDFEIPGAYRYRDYVIRALNADLPYDQFVVEHVAGDLLPQPRRNPRDGSNESVIATGWYFFGEAVHSPVDVRADEATRMDNQIDVFAKTFLGLTVSCARCHDHKFDAISTKDYYALAGYLQSSRYQQAYIDRTETLQSTIEQLRAIQAERRDAIVAFIRNTIFPRLAEMANTLVHADSETFDKEDHTQKYDLFYPWVEVSKSGTEASADDFSRQRLELLASLSAVGGEKSAAGQPLDFGGQGFNAWTATGWAFADGPALPLEWASAATQGRFPGQLLAAPTAHSGRLSPKLRGVLHSPTFEITGPKLWYRLHGDGGRVRLIIDGFQLIRNPIYGGLEFPPGGTEPHWHQQDLSKWVGHRAYIELVDDGDGYLALEQVRFAEHQPQAMAPNQLILKMLDDRSLISSRLLAAKYQLMFEQVLEDWLTESPTAPAEAADRAAIVDWILNQQLLDPKGTQAEATSFHQSLSALDQRQRELEATIQPPRTAPAIADGTSENEHVFIRGNHKTLGAEVPRRFLEVLGGREHEPPAKGSGRLELARQMVSPTSCPLVPRVIVNRLWHHHFGSGLVRSPDNFGAMGQPPTHPELLDFLASELVEHGWSLKHVHRLMVLSSAYQMSSHVDPVTDAADPQNKLWHRMAVRRLEAESVRDALLAVSGKLDQRMYGPGVMPYLTEFMVGRGRPNQSGPLDGDGRRSIYLNVRRNFLSPMFLAFDYPTPFTTIGRRGTSNVPAQALTMMNNPLVIEQAGHWADRVLAMPARSPEERIGRMYLTAFGRPPEDSELQAGLEFVQPNDRQAWADLAHVLFNVKEFIYIP